MEEIWLTDYFTYLFNTYSIASPCVRMKDMSVIKRDTHTHLLAPCEFIDFIHLPRQPVKGEASPLLGEAPEACPGQATGM